MIKTERELKLRTGLISYLQILLFTVLITILLYFINGESLIGIDDANIYLVYMRNFANGHGFVYNIGGERVEGFTSLLWTLTGSVFYATCTRPEIALLIVNLLIVSYAIWRICRFINSTFNRPSFLSGHVIFYLALLISLPGFFEWSVLTLMETGLWSSLIILLVLNLLEFNPEESKNNDVQFSILIFLAILTRPEAMLWCAFFLAMKYLKSSSWLLSKKNTMASLTLPLVVYVVTVVLLSIWQKSYFGYFIPNTYYAKVSSDRIDNARAGMKYLAEYFKKAPFVFLIFILLLNHLVTKLKGRFTRDASERRRPFILLLFSGIFLISFTIPLITGGDHFAFCRLIQPAVPLFLLYFFFATIHYNFSLSRLWKVLIVFFVIISSDFSLFYTARNLYSPLKIEWTLAVADRKTSEKLNDFFDILPGYPSQGVITAGASAYFYKGVTIDLLGLNNTKMAHADPIKDNTFMKDHASFNKEIFFQQSPDLFWIAGKFNPNGKEKKIGIDPMLNLICKRIAEDKRFCREYSQCIIFRKDKEENLQIFASRKFINSLDTTQYKVLGFD